MSGRNPDILAALGQTLGLQGRTAEARAILAELEAMSKTRHVPSYNRALVYAGLGDRDAAFDWLGRARDERYGLMILMAVDPDLEATARVPAVRSAGGDDRPRSRRAEARGGIRSDTDAEGDTIARAAAALHRALAGSVVTAFATGLAQLARVDDQTPIAGRVIERCESRGKHLLMRFSGGLTLRTHMRMRGSWHLYRPGERWQRHERAMRIRIDTAAWTAVAFDMPVAEFVRDADLGRHRPVATLGPDLADPGFDRAAALARLTGAAARPVGDALLDQRLVAGVGNVLRSESLFMAGLHPDRPVAALRARRAGQVGRHGGAPDPAKRPADGGTHPQHDRTLGAGRGAVGLSTHRAAVPALRHRDPIRRARRRRAPRLLVSDLSAGAAGHLAAAGLDGHSNEPAVTAVTTTDARDARRRSGCRHGRNRTG